MFVYESRHDKTIHGVPESIFEWTSATSLSEDVDRATSFMIQPYERFSEHHNSNRLMYKRNNIEESLCWPIFFKAFNEPWTRLASFGPAARDGALDFLTNIKQGRPLFWQNCCFTREILGQTTTSIIAELRHLDSAFLIHEKARREGVNEAYMRPSEYF